MSASETSSNSWCGFWGATEKTHLLYSTPLLALCKKSSSVEALVAGLNEPVLLKHYKRHNINEALKKDILSLAAKFNQLSANEGDYIKLFNSEFISQGITHREFGRLVYRSLKSFNEDAAESFDTKHKVKEMFAKDAVGFLYDWEPLIQAASSTSPGASSSSGR